MAQPADAHVVGSSPRLRAVVPVAHSLDCRALSNVADEGLLTEGFFWIPSLAGPTSIAAQKTVRPAATASGVVPADMACSCMQVTSMQLMRFAVSGWS